MSHALVCWSAETMTIAYDAVDIDRLGELPTPSM
jgi:hypothetical protein